LALVARLVAITVLAAVDGLAAVDALIVVDVLIAVAPLDLAASSSARRYLFVVGQQVEPITMITKSMRKVGKCISINDLIPVSVPSRLQLPKI
jgi:hypothetical protein